MCVRFVFLLVVLVISYFESYSQVYDFYSQILSRNTSPIITGLGGGGVALSESDATMFSYNPAALGLMMQERNIMTSYNTNISKINGDEAVKYHNLAIALAYDVSNSVGFPLNIGIGYLSRNSELGLNAIENPEDYDLFCSSDNVRNYAISLSTKYYAKYSIGFTYKSIYLDHISTNNENPSNTSSSAYDFGVLINIPIIENYSLFDRINTDISANLAWALQNLGSGILLNDGTETALPRSSNLGYNISAKVKYDFEEFSIDLIKVDWATTIQESLAYGDKTKFGYDSPFNELDFVDNIISLNANNYVSTGFGWNISLFETFSILKGWSLDINRLLPADGIIISSKGIFKILDSKFNNKVLKYLNYKIEINYSMTKNTMPLIESSKKWIYETYQGFNISYKL